MKRFEPLTYETVRQHDEKLFRYSMEVWPFSMALLCLVGVAATLLDYMSTYVMLELRGDIIREGNIFSRALLERGGWEALLIKDFLVITMFTLVAFTIYQVAARRNIAGMGRLLGVILLQVYLWARLIPSINNVIITRL